MSRPFPILLASIVTLTLFVAGCSTTPPTTPGPSDSPPPSQPPTQPSSLAAPAVSQPAPSSLTSPSIGAAMSLTVPPITTPSTTTASGSPPPTSSTPPAPRYDRVGWTDIPGWGIETTPDSWDTWVRTCGTLQRQSQRLWQNACAEAARVARNDPDAQRRYFEANFTPYRLTNPDGTQSGLVTGYYEPLLQGSRKRTTRFRYPLLAPPPDLVAVDLGETNPELKDRRIRGRIVGGKDGGKDGGKLVPYYARADIVNGTAPVKGREIAWVDDPVELFFLQVQGSGRIQLPDGSVMRVGYADHNGHPYRSIGRWLVDAGELSIDQASMQGIKGWVKRYPDRANDLFNQNPAYVFFREMPSGPPDLGPNGSLGIPLKTGASIAVDPRAVPLGTPVWLSTTWPLSTRPLNRLVLAHDTGSAIRGAVRADFFWGFGAEAGEQAGRMKQAGAMWILWPNGESLPSDM